MRTKKQMFVLGTAALALILTACSNPEDDHRAALDQAIPNDLMFADDSNVACIRTAIEEKVGLDGLNQKGLGTEALAAGTADVGSLFAEVDATTIEMAYNCIDADSRYIEQFQSQLSYAVEPGCVSDENLRLEDQANAVLANGEIAVNRDLRDVVRGCVADEDFAELFGLDNPPDLAAALKVDPIGIELTDEEITSCVGSAIIDSIGAERLNDAGVSIAQPHPYAGAASLSDDEMDLVSSALVSCEAVKPMLIAKAVTEEPQAGECAIEKLNGELRVELLDTIRTDSRRWKRGSFDSALDECIEQLLNERFGPEEPISTEKLATSRGYIIGATSDPAAPEANEFEEACMRRSVPLHLTDQGLLELYQFGIGEQVELSQAAFDLAASTTNCIDPIKNLRADLTALGFSTSTVECVAEDFEPDQVALVYDASLHGPEADPGEVADYFDALSDLEGRIDDCATVTELNKWNDTIETA